MTDQGSPVPTGLLLLESVNRLRRAETMLQTRARSVMGLGASDFRAAQFLAASESADEPARAIDLADMLGVTSAAATMIVDRLVARGLAFRAPDVDDRRSRIVRLTPEGHAGLLAAYEGLPEAVQDILDAVPAEDAHRIIDLAAAVQHVVDRTAPPSAD